MDIFDIYIAYVSWGSDGKKRPVLILEQNSIGITGFNITTKYNIKSEAVRINYFKINDWQQAGLDKQSYIDTKNTVTLPISSVDVNHQVGTLTKSDVKKLVEFLSK